MFGVVVVIFEGNEIVIENDIVDLVIVISKGFVDKLMLICSVKIVNL